MWRKSSTSPSQGHGYTRVRDYHGGLREWLEHGLPVDSEATSQTAPAPRARARQTFWERLIDAVGNASFGRLMTVWLGLVVAVAGVIFLLHDAGVTVLLELGQPLGGGALHAALTCLYFSFVTATSVGFGDVTPVGVVRMVASVEAAVALLLFGAVVSKMMGQRQEELTAQIHRSTLEDRLGRVRGNLHMVLGELHALADDAKLTPGRRQARLESVAMVLHGEMRAIHDLLYQPQQVPDEAVVEGLLASLEASLSGLTVAARTAGASGSSALRGLLPAMATLAGGICGECVPTVYAPALRLWMDRIQATAALLKQPLTDVG